MDKRLPEEKFDYIGYIDNNCMAFSNANSKNYKGVCETRIQGGKKWFISTLFEPALIHGIQVEFPLPDSPCRYLDHL